MPVIQAEPLRRVAKEIFVSKGIGTNDADVVIDHLVNANLAGHDSHGIMRVPQYLNAVVEGDVRLESRPEVKSRFTSGAMIDGKRCFGQVGGVMSMSLAVELAKETGIAAVTLTNAYHTGRLGAYAEQATEAGMIGIVMVNAGGGGQWVAPFGGRARRLATNPVSIAAPHKKGFPVLVDIATSVAPEGKIRLFKQRGRPIPAGWIVDGHGNPSNDPSDLYADPPGAILPLGGDAGHKGFGLSVMVDLLAGALSGGGVCTAEEVPAKDNVLMIAIDAGRFAGADVFQRHVESLVSHLQSTPAAPGFERVYVPGELEYLARVRRQQEGIDVDGETWQTLSSLAEQEGIEFTDF